MTLPDLETNTTPFSTPVSPQNAVPEVDRYLPARAVWERYGVTSMSLSRWVNDPLSDFPQPLYIGRFRYWKLADLVAWERSRPQRQRKAA